jgi:hypothetical protein
MADPGEVVPFEAAPAQPIDPRLAWDEALACARCFQPAADLRPLRVPPDWPSLVAGHEPLTALPFCLGNFPQLVRDLHALLHGTPAAPRAVARPVPTVAEWAAQEAQKRQFPQALLTVAVLRLARQYDSAADLLRQLRDEAPAGWQAAWANEEAALAWHRGQADEAVRLWQGQPDSAPVLFNRGMAALFTGRPDEARAALGGAVEQLPEDGTWHHLGRLYLALAEMHAAR